MAISSRQYYYLGMAIKESEKSELNNRHGAIIVQNNRIVAKGYNKNEASRKKLLLWYGPKKCSSCNTGFIHAEYDALYALIINTRHTFRNTNIRRKKFDIYVARNTFQNSKPCIECLCLLRAFGISRVFYTDSHEMKSEKVNSMYTNHNSSSRKWHP